MLTAKIETLLCGLLVVIVASDSTQRLFIHLHLATSIRCFCSGYLWPFIKPRTIGFRNNVRASQTHDGYKASNSFFQSDLDGYECYFSLLGQFFIKYQM